MINRACLSYISFSFALCFSKVLRYSESPALFFICRSAAVGCFVRVDYAREWRIFSYPLVTLVGTGFRDLSAAVMLDLATFLSCDFTFIGFELIVLFLNDFLSD